MLLQPQGRAPPYLGGPSDRHLRSALHVQWTPNRAAVLRVSNHLSPRARRTRVCLRCACVRTHRHRVRRARPSSQVCSRTPPPSRTGADRDAARMMWDPCLHVDNNRILDRHFHCSLEFPLDRLGLPALSDNNVLCRRGPFSSRRARCCRKIARNSM